MRPYAVSALLVLLLGATAYLIWQVRLLRAEVARLEGGEVGAGGGGEEQDVSAGTTGAGGVSKDQEGAERPDLGRAGEPYCGAEGGSSR